MNLIQMFRRIDSHSDKARAPRWSITDNYLFALNVAMSTFINDRVDNIREQRKKYAFETAQRIKDDLRTIVKSSLPITPINGILTVPLDYRYEVGVEVFINGKRTNSVPVTHNELPVLKDNLHTRPSKDRPVHYVDMDGFHLLAGEPGLITVGIISYIIEPSQMYLAEDPADRTTGLSQDSLVALIVGATYYVITTAEHNTIFYNPGDTFVAVTTVLTSGTVHYIVNCQLPAHTHEEICLMAAEILTGRAQKYEKRNLLVADKQII